MTSRPFQYSPALLEECATSGLAAFVESGEEPVGHRPSFRSPPSAGDKSCLDLFEQYSEHYGRRSSRDDFSVDHRSYRLSDRLTNFVRSVLFVHQHNHQQQQVGGSSHSVTLNRFSDLAPDAILPSEEEHQDERRHLLEASEGHNAILDDDFFRSAWGAEMDVGLLTTLTTSKMIRDVEPNLGIGHGSINRFNIKQKKKAKTYQEDVSRSVYLPLDDHQGQFETPAIKGLDGSLMSIKESQQHRHERHHLRKHAPNATDTEDDWFLDLAGDRFADYLNWASAANPDGVSIVHEAFDQGGCGSCWAAAATGSLEASASRKAAFDAYHYYMDRYPPEPGANATSFEENDAGIAFAQRVEQESIQVANLSIQELLDCDQVADQGCTGGNPLLAFYFIHRFGLTSWDDYPYVGFRDECRKDLVKHPIATVKSWGIISPNHERHMELALRYIGPVAVGVNGANRHFLSYYGGIFDRPSCKQGANHALLITGYGQEVAEDGTVVKYWICRNSWGTGWGENGYVRIKRGEGSKGIPGVCGIARSPSVALGGALVGRATPSFQELVPSQSFAETARGNDFCNIFPRGQDGVCGTTLAWVHDHEYLSAALIGMVLAMFAIWPLTLDCRRRRRRRRTRELKRQSELIKELNGETAVEANENDPLVANTDKPDSYGGMEATNGSNV